jgi:hypothetical protein
MRNTQLVIVAAALLISGCEKPVALTPTGGSRADGTVHLSYQYGAFEKPVVDREQAQASANRACSGWGYTGSQPFGGVIQKCQAFNQYGCVSYLVTVTYQCTGAPSAPK